MSPGVASLLFAVWLLTVGLLGVHFEVESVYCGTRVEALLEEEHHLLDQLRRREATYNTLLSPDLLEAYIEYKRENEITPLRSRPHPLEFVLYFDA